MIASSQPQEIQEIVAKYKQDSENLEGMFLDTVIKSDGVISYAEVMNMPVDAIQLFIKRLNKHREDLAQARKSGR